jgi:hypothetical protein
MGKQSSELSLAGFARIAPSIYVQDPQVSAHDHRASTFGPPPHTLSFSSFCLPSGPAAKLSVRSRDTPPPDLIIITSWTGAAAKHIAKYTAAYNTLYPGIPILVITTDVSDLCLRSTKHKLAVLAPAVTYLLSHSPAYYHPRESFHPANRHRSLPPPTKPRFTSCLLHAFSEGGAHKAVLLARAFLSTTNARLPIAAFLLDSTPGSASYRRASTGFARALPGNQDNVLGKALAAGVVGAVWLVTAQGGTKKKDSFIEETRRALNDESLWAVRGVPRTYLFGEEDEVVWWEDVHRHGVESANLSTFTGSPQVGGGGYGPKRGRESGAVGSLMVRFKRTEHCAHAKGVVNGQVYWAAVRQTWEAREDGGMGLCLGLGRRLSLDSLCLSE